MQDLVTTEEIAQALGVTRQLVHYWRAEHVDFPKALRQLGTGRTSVFVWSRADISTWAKKVGRPIEWPPAADLIGTD